MDDEELTSEQERGALDEGRRAFALDVATRGSYYEHDVETLIERAEKFEAYLRGDDG